MPTARQLSRTKDFEGVFLATGDLPPHTGRTPGVAKAYADAGEWGRWDDDRCAPGGAVGRAESIPDLERRIEQQENYLSTLLGSKPRPYRTRLAADRTAASAGSAGRAPFQSAGEAARYPRSRGTTRSRQRTDRSGQGSLLPGHLFDRDCRLCELSTDQPLYWPCRILGFWRRTDTTNFFRRQDQGGR